MDPDLGSNRGQQALNHVTRDLQSNNRKRMVKSEDDFVKKNPNFQGSGMENAQLN